MSEPTPIIDPRDAAAVRTEVTSQLQLNVPELSPTEPDQGSAALIGVFARFCEIAIQRLNQVPGKNLLAFLDLLGLARQPPQPARVPLTFTLATGSVSDAVVPAGTQAAAPPAEGEKNPVVFETERELTVVAAKLQTLITLDADRDMVADHSALLTNPATQGVRILAGDRLNEHVLYIGHADLGLQNVDQVEFDFTSHGAPPTGPGAILARELTWEAWDGVSWRAISPDHVSAPEFLAGTFTFTDRHPIPPQTIGGVTSNWMRCRAPRPISPGAELVELMTPAALLPTLEKISASVHVARSGFRPDAVIVNGQSVDATKPFHPFGEKPKLGDVMYIGSREAFGRPSTVVLNLPVINPSVAADDAPTSALPPVQAFDDLVLRWEVWNSIGWALLGDTSPLTGDSGLSVDDHTGAFTRADSTEVEITLGRTAPTTINGITNHWIRVSIVRGNYGADARFVENPGSPGEFTVVPATFAPPVLQSIGVSYTSQTEFAPADVVADNNLEFENLGATFVQRLPAMPFRALPALPPTLYMAFTLPAARKTFPTRPISLYHGFKMPDYGVTSLDPQASNSTTATDEQAETRRRTVRWEYWNGSAWATLPVIDATEALTRSGVVEFLGPSDIVLAKHFGSSGYWLRAVCEPGEQAIEPRLRTLLLNTTFASQTVTVRNELLGSSDATASQRFQTVRTPVLLASHQLEVREPGPLTREELEALQAAHGDSGVTLASDRANEVWVRWIAVPDLYASGPLDRHYVLDHMTGQVTFGDGVLGRIPPRGLGNVRMARYQTGGGSSGNRAAGTIVQIKTTVPFISGVSNPEAAAGGFAAEEMSAVIERGPHTLRHGGRAVAFEDYENLARLASPEVSRAKCVPLRLLLEDPLGATPKAGAVSVIVVPGTADPKPVPSLELLTRVKNFLHVHQAANAEVQVVGPLYVRVDVRVKVVLAKLEGSSQVDVAIRSRLAAFLHPLTGGRDGTGWDFGRQPQLSDLHAVIGSVPGVDHIRKLTMTQVEEPPGTKRTERFLVYSGRHQIDFTFAGVQ